MPGSLEKFRGRAVGHTSSNGVEILKLLLATRADVNAQQRDRKTPLHLAASDGHLEIVKILIENKANVKARDLYKNTPLMCAVVAKHKDVEKFLRQIGAGE